jgi:hypothetical protein
MYFSRAKHIPSDVSMNTYLLSRFGGSWFVHRYDGDIALIASDIVTESEAMEIAMNLARKNRPSQVMKMSHVGESTIVRSFADTAQSSSTSEESATDDPSGTR